MAYPYTYGWCQTTDVVARVKQGTYTLDTPGNLSTAQVNNMIAQGAAQIDAVLLKAGYGVQSGGGLNAIAGQTIWPQVFTMLLDLNATYSAALVEMWRHGADSSNNDSQAERLMGLADDLLARIETGAVNLGQMGVDGPFEPQADPSTSMDAFMDDPDPVTGVVPAPIFTTEQTDAPPLSVW